MAGMLNINSLAVLLHVISRHSTCSAIFIIGISDAHHGRMRCYQYVENKNNLLMLLLFTKTRFISGPEGEG